MTRPDLTDDFVADSHADLDPGEYGTMADSDYYDRISAAPADCASCSCCTASECASEAGCDHDTCPCWEGDTGPFGLT